jgi:hypothetical protein
VACRCQNVDRKHSNALLRPGQYPCRSSCDEQIVTRTPRYVQIEGGNRVAKAIQQPAVWEQDLIRVCHLHAALGPKAKHPRQGFLRQIAGLGHGEDAGLQPGMLWVSKRSGPHMLKDQLVLLPKVRRPLLVGPPIHLGIVIAANPARSVHHCFSCLHATWKGVSTS